MQSRHARPARSPRRLVCVPLLAALVAALLPGLAGEAQVLPMAPSADANTVVAVVAPGVDLAAVDAQARESGLIRVGAIPEIGVLQYRPGGSGLAWARARLAAIPGVRPSAPATATALATSTDPLVPLQWGLTATHAAQAWTSTTGSGITVAIVDTGVATSHPDLASQIAPGGYDFVNHDADPSDDNGHGTHVAGIVGAVAGNGIAGAGAAPGVRILPVKVLDASGSGSSTNIAAGITYAVDHGAQVVNLSLGGSGPMPDVAAAIGYAVSRNVVVVAAAGNDGNAVAVGYPAAYSNVISVGAVDSGLRLANFSQTGPALDIVAPGVSIVSTFPPAAAATGSGTSMAAPFVSAAAALLLSVDRSQSPAAVQSRLEATADDLGPAGRDTSYGAGLVDMARAVASLGAGATPTPTPGPTATPAPTPIPATSPTASPAPSQTPAPDASPSPSPTASASPGASSAPSPTPSSGPDTSPVPPAPGPSASPTPTPSPGPLPSPTVTRAIAIRMARPGVLYVRVTASSRTVPLRLAVRTSSGTNLGSVAGQGTISWSRSVRAGWYVASVSAPKGTSITVSWRPGSSVAFATRMVIR